MRKILDVLLIVFLYACFVGAIVFLVKNGIEASQDMTSGIWLDFVLLMHSTAIMLCLWFIGFLTASVLDKDVQIKRKEKTICLFSK